jgi:hypothetical protein
MTYIISEEERIAGRTARELKKIRKKAQQIEDAKMQLEKLENQYTHRIVPKFAILQFRSRWRKEYTDFIENPSLQECVDIYSRAVELEKLGYEVSVDRNACFHGYEDWPDRRMRPKLPLDALVLSWIEHEPIENYNKEKEEYYKVETEKYFENLAIRIADLKG